MSVEPTGFDIFGIRINHDHIMKIQDSFAIIYKQIEKENERWGDTEFCKRQIGSLWGGIVELLSRMSENPFGQGTLSSENRFKPIVDRDNEVFLKALSIELKEKQVISDILNQLNILLTAKGSIRFWDSSGKRSKD
jgi:hypothetical protein